MAHVPTLYQVVTRHGGYQVMFSTAFRQLAVPQLSKLAASAWLLRFLTAAAPQAQEVHGAHSAAAVVLNGAKLQAVQRCHGPHVAGA